MNSKEITVLYNTALTSDYKIRKKEISLQNPGQSFRPNIISIEDAFFGDSGKGAVTAKFNHILNKEHNLLTMRFNGGANAGHETLINGQLVVTHQVPTGVVCEGATALMTRGMVVHPEDLLAEIRKLTTQFNGTLPGTLLIDERITLALDTHRALEGALNVITTGGRGSTGRGIAASYASHYERIPVTFKDLLKGDWEEVFRAHYRLYQSLITGFPNNRELANSEVITYTEEKVSTRKVGNEDVFIQRLKDIRDHVLPFISANITTILETAWKNTDVPITLEGAQGAGIDPFHGVYPDVTASRPMSRNINDATYNIIDPSQIYYRVAVFKTTYMSSVGTRKLPTIQDKDTERWIQQAFDEKGRSTGRMRDIYPISLPIASYLRIAAGFRFTVATHLDASKPDVPVNVITHYTDKNSGMERCYFPYQDYMDTLDAHTVTFDGWDGEAVKDTQSFDELPKTTRNYLGFLSQTIAPITMVTTGPDLEDHLKWNI